MSAPKAGEVMPGKTVFVTGATGFIAKHIVLKLLNAGYRVRGSVRSLERGAEVREAVLPHLDAPDGLDARLAFVALDLMQDAGWEQAMQGCDTLIHTASPFPIAQPEDEQQLIRPAVDGALRALRAAQAAGIGRVVLTSSEVAVKGCDLPPGRDSYTEADWTDIDRPGTQAYAKSKTLAERAAWDFIAAEAPDMALTTINPVFVLGPPLDRHFGSSVGFVGRLLRGKDPMMPNFGMTIVDVRDVAVAHVRALSEPASIGKRILVADDFRWAIELSRSLKAAYPDRRLATRRAPDVIVRFLALFDKEIRSIVPTLGESYGIDTTRAQQVLGMEFIGADDALLASAEYLTKHDLV